MQVRAHGAAFDAEFGGQFVHRLTSEVTVHQGVDRSRIEPLLHLPNEQSRRGCNSSRSLPDRRSFCGQLADQGLCHRGQGWNVLSKLPLL